MKNWVKIYESNNLQRAEIAKSVLIDNEIDAVVLNKKDQSYLFGHYEVMVQNDNVLISKKLINEIFDAEEPQ